MTKQKIIILGGGESGVGAAVLAQKHGYDVFLSDKNSLRQQYRDELNGHKISFEEGLHSYEKFENAIEVIKSPGIPDKADVIKYFKQRNIPLISEIEFAGRYTDAKKICITGTNGKTTTTMLMYHVLKNAGFSVGVAGNIGKSFARQVAENNFENYVIELSSFQLDGMYKFKADVAIMLNITPDHLDRYEYSLQNYVDSKFRIMQNQTANDAFVFCADDEVIASEIQKRNPSVKMFPFSIKEKENMTAYLETDQLIINTNTNQFTMSIFDLALKGKHNIYNTMAAGIPARLFEIRKEDLRESFMNFESVEHRLEFVYTIYGVDFINDSKATNVNSAWYALESMNKPVIWIAGGQDKGNDYSMLDEMVREKVKAIVCLGLDNEKIKDAYGTMIPDISETDNAKAAVRVAFSKAKKGDVVLLSPACASFDLFKNYEDRGRQFKAAVKEL